MEMTVANDDQTIKEGLTAKILIPYQEDKAFRVSPSVLSLADNGAVGVKIVNAQNIVEFKPVQLLKDTPDYLWISGLPDTVTLITVGQEFVVTGQKVTPIKNNTKNAEPGSL
jgi:multidrug efflux system membrane fusion protein